MNAETLSVALKKELKKHIAINVGIKAVRRYRVSPTDLKKALYLLQVDGYCVYAAHLVRNKVVPILCKPKIRHKDVYNLLPLLV